MKKEELEAIFSDGANTPDIGPIEDYLHAVATERKLPNFAVGMCTLRIEEAAPKLRAVLARAAEGKKLSDDESLLLFRGLHILGGARDHESCQPLLRLLRRPFDEVDALLGDAVTETLAKIVTGMFDDDIDALLALIIDSSINEFIREALLGAATFLTWERRIERDPFRDFLVRFHEERPAEDNIAPWAGWVTHRAARQRELVPLPTAPFAKAAYPKNGLIGRQFDKDIAEAERAPDDIEVQLKYTLVTSRMCWYRWSGRTIAKTSSTRTAKKPRGPISHTGEPVRNPWRHVGRNDPCPCGSGKKFKKCCLANGGPPA